MAQVDVKLCEVRQLIPENITHLLPVSELDRASLFLLQETQDTLLKCRQPDKALKTVEYVLEMTWEDLNTGHWKNIPVATRQLYSAAVLIKIDALLCQCEHKADDRLNLLHTAMKTADLGLLLGAPFGDICMTKIAGLLSDILSLLSSGIKPQEGEVHVTNNIKQNTDKAYDIPGIKGQLLNVLEKPSLEGFRTAYFSPQIPVKLTGCMSHWPALHLWEDINYLKRVAGTRTVPIELGVHYTHPEWSQKLMTIGEFIETHIASQTGESKCVGYLAQHPLFEQVPELRKDIFEPEYCCLSDNLDDETTTEETDINAWFGPKGTVSPIHHDPKHNLLTQVVGEKRILLYHPDDSEKLYPHEGSLLSNTAQVDPENPDYDTFPLFKDAKAWECHLRQGEMLYIPPKWWHHVRSLSLSFSVSFWWT